MAPSVKDVPSTVAEVRLRYPGAVVETKHEKSEEIRGGNCGHAGVACALLLLLPSRPPEYDLVVASEGGAPVFEATFEGEKRLLSARVRAGKAVRYVSRRRFLTHDILVEAEHADIASDGKEGPRRPTPILSQIDLRPLYLGAMSDPLAPWDRRMEAVQEFYITFPDEQPTETLIGWMNDPAVSGLARRAILNFVCDRVRFDLRWPFAKPTREQRKKIVEPIRATASAEIAQAARSCFGKNPEEIDDDALEEQFTKVAEAGGLGR